MARFSVGGDEDGNEDGSNNDRPLPKRLRTAAVPIVYTAKRSNGSTSSSGERPAVASDSANPEPCTTVPTEESRLAEEVWGEESEEESDASVYDSEEEEESEDGYEDEEEEEEAEEQQNPRSGGEAQPIEARLNSVGNGNGAAREAAAGGDAQAPFSVTLTDPDVLDCPICLEPLSAPVYQCENGHIACGSCCTKMKNRCASCCWPIGYNRCRAIEKVLDSVRVSCRNTPHGCTMSINYSKKLEHEETCIYTPCSCPYHGCNYVGSAKSLYVHFTSDHPRSAKLFRFNCTLPISLSNNQKHVFLQDKNEHTLFVLNRCIEPFGNSVSIVCIAPPSSNRQFIYELTAREGVNWIQMKTVAETAPQWVPQPPAKKQVVIPKDYMTFGGELHLELNILREANC